MVMLRTLTLILTLTVVIIHGPVLVQPSAPGQVAVVCMYIVQRELHEGTCHVGDTYLPEGEVRQAADLIITAQARSAHGVQAS